MTPKLRSVRKSLDMLREALERDVDKLAARIEEVDTKRTTVFESANGSVLNAHKELSEVEQYLSEVARTNGGPTDESGLPTNVVSHPRSSEVAKR